MPKTPRIPIRELRGNLKKHLNSGTTLAIGGPYELRAFLVSLPPHTNYDSTQHRKALAAAKTSFLDALRAEAD
ncbi:MAG: hypothetical protein LAN61_10495 [Acidobacteriia bacterium]|nr:hypothetical protein [Terriglobia bacterium]